MSVFILSAISWLKIRELPLTYHAGPRSYLGAASIRLNSMKSLWRAVGRDDIDPKFLISCECVSQWYLKVFFFLMRGDLLLLHTAIIASVSITTSILESCCFCKNDLCSQLIQAPSLGDHLGYHSRHRKSSSFSSEGGFVFWGLLSIIILNLYD